MGDTPGRRPEDGRTRRHAGDEDENVFLTHTQQADRMDGSLQWRCYSSTYRPGGGTTSTFTGFMWTRAFLELPSPCGSDLKQLLMS